MVVDGDGDGDEMAQREVHSADGHVMLSFPRGPIVVDALDVLSDLEDAKREQASDLLGRIVAMLTKLCR